MAENLRFDLARLLHPVLPTVFFAEYWEEKPLLVSRTDRKYYESLLTLDQIDPLLTVFPADSVLLVNSDDPLKVEELALTGSTLANAALDVVKACQLFANGATILVREADKRIATLAALTRELEREIGAPFQNNLYMTPAGGKGFDTHYDTHDVFVLQVAGSKEWTIFDSPVRLPLNGQPFDASVHPVGKATMHFVLNAGDFLYIPRGFLHHGRSCNETSLHVTLGALSYRWADVLIEVMAQLCLSDPTFRRALPIDMARTDFDLESARRVFDSLMSRAAATAKPDQVLDRLADEFVLTRRAHIPGQLAQVAQSKTLSADDRVGVRPGTIYRLQTEDDIVRIQSYGRKMDLPIEAAEAVKFALGNDRYRVCDLPGDLDDEEKLILVRQLIDEGLVWKLAAR